MSGEFVFTSAPLAGFPLAELFYIVFVFFTVPDFIEFLSAVVCSAFSG
jgi:hypothetical protein